MYQTLLLGGLLAFTVTACNQSPEAVEEPPFRVVTDLHHTMELILDPAADMIWSSAGPVITADGEKDLSPTTDEGWHQLEQSAAVLTEAGNLLMLPGRALGDDWVEYSRGLIDAGELALLAAQQQDKKALFDAGGQIYQVCLACHNQYWTDEGTQSE